MRARSTRSDGSSDGGASGHPPPGEAQQKKGSAPPRAQTDRALGSVASRCRPNGADEADERGGRQFAAAPSSPAHPRARSQIEDEIGPPSEQLKKSANSSGSNRLVFGLNPRANKVRHDEYAERRAKQQSELVKGPEANRGNRSVADQSSGPKQIGCPKYATANRPLDSILAEPNLPAASEPKRVVVRQRSESPERRRVTTATTATATATATTTALSAGDASHSSGADEKEPTRRVARREDKYRKSQEMVLDKCPASSRPDEPDQTQSKPRMQFNIPPPPKINSGSATKSSIISYAKSRIYDKQQQIKPATASHQSSADVLLDNSNIPESILSGFKPPKQVNVSKAREKWEGGEPFAKCKSRQRLAQSANKKVLYGTWSMTSVVATQQLQFQQALAQSRSSSSSSSFASAYPNEPPVKILTRGSVLERVQQYEQAPAGLRSGSGGSLSSSTGSLSSSSSSSSSNSSSNSSSPASTSAGDLSCLSPSIGGPAAAAAAGPTGPAAHEASIRTQHGSSTAAVVAAAAPLKPTPDSPPACANLNRRLSFRRRSSASSAGAPSIPRFYHPNGKPNTYEIELQKKNIVSCFDKFPDRKALLTAPTHKRHFHSIALACGFSEYFKEPLYRYIKHQMSSSDLLLHTTSLARKQSGFGPSMANGISSLASGNGQLSRGQTRAVSLTRASSVDNSTVEKVQNQNYISCEQFLTCWRHLINSCYDNPARFVHLLTLGKRNYLLPEDFVPLIQSVIDDHPGLKFLRSAPDFHLRYIQTVIARIYFCCNRSWTGKLSLAELRRSNLLQVLEWLAREEDINQVTEYFSYEHFYVIYCKFWSLDQDHDLLISKEDLARHQDASISSRVIDRIFTGVVSKRIQELGKMSYADFVWFLIAEEDKKHPRSIEYWFRLMDIDGDGYISMYEMEYFYYEQTKRLELMNIEALPFLDSACQILDLINPREKNKISLSDLKRTKLATIFFDTFINLEKYLEHESREFVSARDCIQNGRLLSDWDRYASEAYESLVTEESSV